MDFLDPRKRKARRNRLIIGYFLFAVVIALATVILVYGANGVGINTKTGQIVENGLLFVDSQPGGATISLNGKAQGPKTGARFVLPAGIYKLSLSKAGYRGWSRSIVLYEQGIDRYVYPFLFPTKPQITQLKLYPSIPPLLTETPDRHFLLVAEPGLTSLTFDQYDSTDLAAGSQVLNLPRDLITGDASPTTFKEVEWSDDNKHLLLQHDTAAGREFIVFDRSDPTKSFNVNKLFNVSPTDVRLRDKKIDQLYIYNQTDASLQVADTGQGILLPVFLHHVLAFKAYGSTLITYVTDIDGKPGQVQARIWDDGKTYPLYTFNAGSYYLIDAAQFQSHWYYVAGSDKADRIAIFKDPIDSINNPTFAKAVPLLSFVLPQASKLSFSENTRFISVEAGQSMAVYDIERAEAFYYTVKAPLTAPLHWMDGHRLIGQSAGNVYVIDFDNNNPQSVTPTIYPQGAYFNRNYQQMMTLADSPNGPVLERVDMRAGADLPANGKQ
jgi:PEGA domain